MDAGAISAAQEDYLEAILVLEAANGRVRVRDLAERLSVHKSTVTAALKGLTEKMLIDYEPYGRIALTRQGRHAAERVSADHAVAKAFLTDVLLVDAATAEENACRMEHVMDRDVLNRLVSFAAFMERRAAEGGGIAWRVSRRIYKRGVDENRADVCRAVRAGGRLRRGGPGLPAETDPDGDGPGGDFLAGAQGPAR